MKSMLDLYQVIEQEKNPTIRNQILSKIEDLRKIVNQSQEQLICSNTPLRDLKLPKPLDLNQTSKNASQQKWVNKVDGLKFQA